MPGSAARDLPRIKVGQLSQVALVPARAASARQVQHLRKTAGHDALQEVAAAESAATARWLISKQRIDGVVGAVADEFALSQTPHLHPDQAASARPCRRLACRSHGTCQEVAVGADTRIDSALDGADYLRRFLPLVDHQAAGDGVPADVL